MRSRYCRVCHEFHALDAAWPLACAAHIAAAPGPAFYVIPDQIEPFRSMADGQVYDSKSRYRADLRARGLVELGNDRVERRETAAPPVRDDVRRAIRELGG